MPPVELVLLFAASTAAGWLLTSIIRRVALRAGVVDVPNARSSHTRTTPRGGGSSMLLVFVVAVAVGWFALGLVPARLALALLCSSVPVATVGLLDDRRDVSPTTRLAVHVVAVGLGLAIAGTLPWTGATDVAWVWYLLVGLGCVWFVNLFNFMDGIDGIAACEALFVALSAALLLWILDSPPGLLWTWTALAGASAGFLVLNLPPARIFMGDVGSGFLGITIAMLLVASTQVAGFSAWTALILVGVFAADATVTLIRRTIRRRPWLQAHRSHAYQRLARRWGGHGRVSGLYMAINALLVLPAAFASIRAPALAPGLALAVLLALCLAAWFAGAGVEETGGSARD